MIKIRNKRIALLLVLAMLATMFVGMGTVSAADGQDYIVVTSDWTPVDADSKDYAGPITVEAGADFDGANLNIVYASITLPDDGEVKFANTPTLSGSWELESKNDYELVLFNNTDDFSGVVEGDLLLEVSDIYLNLSADASGTISAAVELWAENTDNNIVNQEKDTVVPIAKIDSADISVKASTKVKTVTVGDEEVGSKITFTEKGYSSFDANNVIKVTIKKSGVTWDSSVLDYDGDDFDQFVETGCEVNYDPGSIHFDGEPWISNNGKVLNFTVSDLNDIEKGNVVLTPLLVVKPGTTGDITVEVSDEEHNIDTATFTIAKVGTDGVAVSVKNDDKDFVYRGQTAVFDEVEVKLNPGHALDAEDWFSVTLPEGVQFIKGDEDWVPFNMYDYYGDAIEDDNDYLDYDGLFNNNRTAWFTVDEDDNDNLMIDIYDNILLTDFAVIADADAVVGDLNITFDGAVEGTYKIGSVKNAFTITAAPAFQSQAGSTVVNGANIVITETDDGALRTTFGEEWWLHGGVDYWYQGEWEEMWDAFFEGAIMHNDGDYFDIELPAGMSFDGTPTVKVTKGDIDLGDVSVLDNDTLRIEIDETSTDLSEITISNVVYDVLNQPALGDMVAKVGADYNLASDKPLEKLALGSIATNPTSVYVIGASTFTVNGAVQSVVTPSYIKNGRTYLAIRDIATGLGIDPVNVLWDAAASKVTLIKGAKIVQVTIGSNTMLVNGTPIAMDVAPEISNGRAMLPAAFIAQAFGATASWDAATQTVTIK